MRPTVKAFGGRTIVNGGFANSSGDAARANVFNSTEGQNFVNNSLGATLGA